MQTTNLSDSMATPARQDFKSNAGQPRREAPRAAAAEKSPQSAIWPTVTELQLYCRCARFAAIGASLIGGVALFGWLAGLPLLTTLNPAWVSMKMNAAIAFSVSGAGLFAAVPLDGDRAARLLVVRICGGFVAVIGLATAAEYILGVDLGIDQLLLTEPAGTIGTTVPGRMAELTAACFTAFGFALLAHTTRRGSFVSTLLALLVLASSVLVLTGYLLGTGPLYKFSRSTVVAFPTAMAFLLLSAGFLLIPAREMLVTEMYRGTIRYRLYLRIAPYLLAVLGIVLTTVICLPLSLQQRVTNATVALAMLLVVQFAATVGGRWPALLASTLAALAYDYFFLPPFYTFIIASVQDWITLAAFFITAVTVGELSGLARQRAEAAETGTRIARRANAYNRGLLEASLDPLVTIGQDGRITDVNTATETITGQSRGELIGTDFSDYFTNAAQARRGYEEVFHEGLVRDYPLSVRRSGGAVVPVLYNASVYRDENGDVAGVFAAARDISGMQRAEQEIRHLASFPQLTPIPIVEFDRAMRVQFTNPAMEEMIGKYAIDPPKLIPARWVSVLSQPDGIGADKMDTEELQIAGRTFDERIFFTHEFQYLRIWLFDITARKESERLLERLNHTLRTLSSANQTLVHAKTEAELLRDMCQVLVDVGGYRMAWIGLALHDADKSVQVAAVSGHDDGYVEQARISWADNERGRGPTGAAIRTGEAQVNRNFATNPRMAPWRAEALKHGYQSSIALPLTGETGPFGALTIYSGEPDAFVADELNLLRELASDLAYGIVALRSGVEREAAVQRLHEGLEDTVGAIASTIEMRDPYTAGHQRRVARLASLIASELGMTKDQQRGIFFAGLIHDVGKINIPAEILSKPGKLTPLEMQFIRTHPQAGYDIIKGVEFPWPIAETVLQHHERLDGSGYPKGLSADAVIPEARILAVADVTEAITAHRPYRPALGLDAALNEIQSGKGRLYDAAAVDACVDLFRNKGFKFE
jgi:PAS domain S-box-containing protein